MNALNKILCSHRLICDINIFLTTKQTLGNVIYITILQTLLFE